MGILARCLLPARVRNKRGLLADLTRATTGSKHASIKEALVRLTNQEIIPSSDVFFILWTIALQAEGQLRTLTMLVISMAAGADPKISPSVSCLTNLYDAGLRNYTEEHCNYGMARFDAPALKQVARVKVVLSLAKYITLDLITKRLVAVSHRVRCNGSVFVPFAWTRAQSPVLGWQRC